MKSITVNIIGHQDSIVLSNINMKSFAKTSRITMSVLVFTNSLYSTRLLILISEEYHQMKNIIRQQERYVYQISIWRVSPGVENFNFNLANIFCSFRPVVYQYMNSPLRRISSDIRIESIKYQITIWRTSPTSENINVTMTKMYIISVSFIRIYPWFTICMTSIRRIS